MEQGDTGLSEASQPTGNGNPTIFAREAGPISRIYHHGGHRLYFNQDIGPFYDT
jgi:hypothetical protein